MTTKDYCIILCGGTGNRLWPYSRSSKPKQFLDILGTGRTLLQLTYDRMKRIVPTDHIYIATYREYANLVNEQLPEVTEAQMSIEPVQLGTAPSTALAAALVYSICPDANIILTPADQLIFNEPDFIQQAKEGLDFVAHTPNFVVMGIKAERPETSYGYIQASNHQVGRFSQVKSFTEKPNSSYAQLFCDSGEFYWNTGLSLWNVRTMLQSLDESHAELLQIIKMHTDGVGREAINAYIAEHYPRNVYQSIDLLIMERNTNVFLQPCTFQWTDIGSWNDVYDTAQKDRNGNAVLNHQAELYQCHGCLTSLREGKTLFAHGLDNYLVVDSDNLLLICPKDDFALQRRMLTDARFKYGDKVK